METDYTRIGLGFAEFVAQLLRETFDAILDAQSYQLDKFTALRTILQNDTKVFFERYCSLEEVNFLMESTLGFKPDSKRVLTTIDLEILNEIFSNEDQSFIENNLLNSGGITFLFEYFKLKVIDSKREKLIHLINKPELSVLMVDSGEIKSKLELFCYNESVKPIDGSTKSKLKIDEINLAVPNQKMVKEIVDKETGLKTIIIDKSKIGDKISLELPSTRLIANPIKSTTSTNLYSEVTIKFKTI